MHNERTPCCCLSAGADHRRGLRAEAKDGLFVLWQVALENVKEDTSVFHDLLFPALVVSCLDLPDVFCDDLM